MGAMIGKFVFIPPSPFEIRTKDALTYVQTEHFSIPMLYLRGRKQPPEQVIIFSHGNAEDLGAIEGWLQELSRICDADVVGYDYPGYGFSKSNSGELIEPSEQAVYEAIDAVYKNLTTEIKPPISPNKIVLFGRSLGTGPTVDLASRTSDIKGVILQSPLLSVVRVVLKSPFTLPVDMFASIDKIQQVKAPVFICHGEADEVINVSHGRKLSEMVSNNGFPPLFLEGADHDNIELNFFFKYSQTLQNFIAYVNSPQREKEKEGRKGKEKVNEEKGIIVASRRATCF